MAATFELDQLPTKDYYMIRNMEVGDISETYESTDHNKKVCYKLLYLRTRTEPHRANLKQDYLLLQKIALSYKNEEVMKKWYEEKRNNTYIHVDPVYKECEQVMQPSGRK